MNKKKLLASSVLGSGTDNIVDVYAVFGQSNTGSGLASELTPPYTGQQNSWVFSKYGNPPGVYTWQRILPGLNNNNAEDVPGNAGGFGPEIAMGKILSDLKPNKIFFIKSCYPSSSLLGQGGVNDWKIGGPGTNYDAFVTNNLIPGLQALQAQGLTPRFKGILWHQGEAERSGALGYTAPQLQADVQLQSYRLIKQIIDDVNEAGFDTASVRVIWGRIHNTYTVFDPAMLAAVRAAQQTVVANFINDSIGYSYRVKAFTFLDTDAYGLAVDLTHFSTAGQITFGADAGNYFAAFINENVTYAPIVTTGFDADAIALINAAGVRRQGSADAINVLITGWKAQGLWAKTAAMWINCSGTRMGNKLNAKNPLNTDGALRLTFNRQVTQYDAGFQGNLTGGEANTHLAMNALPQNSAGIFFYGGTAAGETTYGNGAINAGVTSRLYWAPRFASDNRHYVAINGPESAGAVQAAGDGSYIATRTGAAQIVTYIRGTKETFVNNSAAGDGTILKICCRSINGTNGSFSARMWDAFGYFNGSINDAEAAVAKTLLDNYVATRWA